MSTEDEAVPVERWSFWSLDTHELTAWRRGADRALIASVLVLFCIGGWLIPTDDYRVAIACCWFGRYWLRFKELPFALAERDARRGIATRAGGDRT